MAQSRSSPAQAAPASAGANVPLGPSYSLTFSFEENFDVAGSVKWFNENLHIPFILGFGVYLSVLYFGQKIMANRDPIKARTVLILWNIGLAIFSIMGFARVAPEFFYTLNKFGFHHTICNNSYLQNKPVAFWIYLFVLSKTPELVDTLFLVLRKQKLIFLHVYHHATVLIFAWFVYANQVAAARWFCSMNYGVHSLMYTYYALKALPNLIWIPKWVSMFITTLQTLQMVAGTYVVSAAFMEHLSGRPCATNIGMSLLGLGIYFSYLILFSLFFYRAYCAPRPAIRQEDRKRV
uniref:Elongation of very long chain fatty acids protein n=1 Tax=Aceria tosichella TaxID=561515 RepID=A0A6G1SEW5_9ACAR